MKITLNFVNMFERKRNDQAGKRFCQLNTFEKRMRSEFWRRTVLYRRAYRPIYMYWERVKEASIKW
jgi:hypothetical protein